MHSCTERRVCQQESKVIFYSDWVRIMSCFALFDVQTTGCCHFLLFLVLFLFFNEKSCFLSQWEKILLWQTLETSGPFIGQQKNLHCCRMCIQRVRLVWVQLVSQFVWSDVKTKKNSVDTRLLLGIVATARIKMLLSRRESVCDVRPVRRQLQLA